MFPNSRINLSALHGKEKKKERLFPFLSHAIAAALSRIKDGVERPIDPAIHFQNEATATAGRSNGAESREFEFIKIKASLAGVGLGAALMRPMMFPMEPGERFARAIVN